MQHTYPTTETLVPSSFATSGIAGMNEPETKTVSHTSKKNRAIAWSVSVMRTHLNEKRERRTGDESSPCDERDDGTLTARREPKVDEIVVSFRSSLGGQQRSLF